MPVVPGKRLDEDDGYEDPDEQQIGPDEEAEQGQDQQDEFPYQGDLDDGEPVDDDDDEPHPPPDDEYPDNPDD